MNATRLFLVLLAMVLLSFLSACGAAQSQLASQLDMTKARYAEAQSAESRDIDAAKLAQQKADAAKAARLAAAQQYASELTNAAIRSDTEAQSYRKEACAVDSSRCERSVSPKALELSVDGKVTSFSEGGFSRFSGSSYPDGWRIVFGSNKFSLVIDGQEKASLSDPSAAGKCYRVKIGEFVLIPCPQ